MNDGWGAQHIIGMVLMALFVVSVIWLIVSFARRNGIAASAAAPAAAVSATKTAEQILAERLATGEIDPADYKARLDALKGL
jgi:uncharacterized membrane protein